MRLEAESEPGGGVRDKWRVTEAHRQSGKMMNLCV